MSYTMTIEAPEKVAWFEQRRQDYSEEQLGDLFIAFLMKRDGEKQDREKTASVSARVHALRGVIRLPENFDERAFKAERLSNRLEVQNLAKSSSARRRGILSAAVLALACSLFPVPCSLLYADSTVWNAVEQGHLTWSNATTNWVGGQGLLTVEHRL